MIDMHSLLLILTFLQRFHVEKLQNKTKQKYGKRHFNNLIMLLLKHWSQQPITLIFIWYVWFFYGKKKERVFL